MIHYTCDRCQRSIDSETEVRYSVDIEVTAVFESQEVYDMDDDADHLMELHEILERLDHEESVPVRDSGHSHMHYDLCTECYKVYVRNPLRRDVPVSIQFSEN